MPLYADDVEQATEKEIAKWKKERERKETSIQHKELVTALQEIRDQIASLNSNLTQAIINK